MNRLAILSTLAFAACFDPTFNNPTCGPGGQCPEGLTCVDNVCRSEAAAIDAPVDTPPGDPDAMVDAATDAPTDGPSIDAPIDGPSIDAVMTCPNGTTEGTEQCDDNNSVNTDDCTAMCRFNVCGDGHIDNQGSRTDTCDDGNAANNDNCVAVTAGGMTQCRPAACGDGFVDTASPGVEGCDDAGNVNGDGCSASCQVESGYQCTGVPSVCGPVCGDGIILPPETCDDRNALSCGTCFSGCMSSTLPRAATGFIQCATGTSQVDGETFTLDDGYNAPTVFEWDRNSSVTAGNVAVPYSTSFGQGQMADALTLAVNTVGSSLLITATHSSGPSADLTHDRLSSRGNRAITENVSASLFFVNGMSGGAAGDCAAGMGCIVDGDCLSNDCDSLTQVCQ